MFSQHHYLDESLTPSAKCFVAWVGSQPVAFAAVNYFQHPTQSCWRGHRTVCLPDYQGVGIGNALSEFVAGLFKATLKPYRSITSHPAMILHRAKSPLWQMVRTPSVIRTGYLNTKLPDQTEKRIATTT